jgi:hypothetical protein
VVDDDTRQKKEVSIGRSREEEGWFLVERDRMCRKVG